ncbi:hypothetical protein DIURU_000693 [Diutina rugosa]|uniref:Endonuclease/exonuclease/phosphatase domain-containing protein n=1 Tax=Diutina rugosa TaxID=5481 RepID=A0A642UWX2_DIURU|nr:uncharacterized protein DIURU_000693 [Diutina rugosa]KAA8907009.1 hypothetical protein DIURU_000693 [Diutina rugosa]
MSTLDIRDASRTLRLVTFNVNGVKTLFNYHPWRDTNGNLDEVLSKFNADVVTFQELKLNRDSLSSIKDIGHLKHFRSFITVPTTKRGYSGVGVFVSNRCHVVKAEEGMTGHLCPQGSAECYRDQNDGIGGYPEVDKRRGLQLDAEGRAITIELAGGLVIISVYCPANSMGTEEGEEYRMDFLRCLFERCRLLHQQGKQVILMGDINVSPSLIDHADTLAEFSISGEIGPINSALEKHSPEACAKFKTIRPSRMLLNEYLYRPNREQNPKRIFIDTTRTIQKQRVRMYTVWNTQKNCREINHGSRIDLILATSDLKVVNANIWPDIMGSDHCPVFTDFEWSWDTDKPSPTTKIPFEAKTHYKMKKTHEISAFFGRKRNHDDSATASPDPPSTEASVVSIETTTSSANNSDASTKTLKLQYVSRKKTKLQSKPSDTKGITGFFK